MLHNPKDLLLDVAIDQVAIVPTGDEFHATNGRHSQVERVSLGLFRQRSEFYQRFAQIFGFGSQLQEPHGPGDGKAFCNFTGVAKFALRAHRSGSKKGEFMSLLPPGSG